MDVVANGKVIPSAKEVFSIISTFILTMFAWIFFRSATLSQAFLYIRRIFSPSIISKPHGSVDINLIALILFGLSIEWIQRDKPHALHFSERAPLWARWASYYLLFFAIFFLSRQQQSFIYFQF
jgi:hypothetical protein